MVETQIVGRGISDPNVIAAMKAIPRECFVPISQVDHAYEDRAVGTELGQTISQPYIVALMTELLAVRPHHRVLEIGTGTGYQTAVLARIACRVYSIERLRALSDAAERRLAEMGVENVELCVGDGSAGWPEAAPFDRIMVTAAAPRVPSILVDELSECGRLVVPVGEGDAQILTVIHKVGGRIIEHPSLAVRFVKLIGEFGFPEPG
ncbi:MAG: protein-L-isoaspartate(D-aspartate) O-methyltransferase [Phycisphaerae bacterium]|nr:protein-L-isoaspartate(D-aspartate) O-methyltransferase [Phycisphaerae bacterium]